MKKIIILIFILLILVGGYFVAAYFSGGSLPTFGLQINSQKAQVRAQALKFWEDIKFKDIQAANLILAKSNQEKQSIAVFLEKIFNQSPQRLDIITAEILKIEIDSTEKRARVKIKVYASDLASGAEIQPEIMLFFYKDQEDNQWLLELNSSF